MPTCDVIQPVSDGSTRQSTGVLVRLGLLLLVSPALILVLIVGGVLVFAQGTIRMSEKVSGLFRRGRSAPRSLPRRG